MIQFELTLQAIDSTVALHYWDPTLDATWKEDWVEHSTIFTDDFFGPINNNNSENIINTGRWAYQPIALLQKHNDSNTGLILNAYGLMAAPWNTSPVPFVVRKGEIFNHKTHFDETIDCVSIAQIAQTEHNFPSLIASLNGKLHGTFHGSVAGYWNYNETLRERVPGLMTFVNFSGLNGINTMTKRFYRWGVVYCPTYCADDVPAVDCACILNPRLSNLSSYDILDTYGVFSDIYPDLDKMHPDKNDYHYDWLLDQGTNGGRPGTAVNDGSPADPAFWIFHGFQERLMNTLQFWQQTGRIDIDYTWGWNDTSYDGRDAGTGFADWSHVDQSNYGMPNVTKDAICPGQYEDDITPYGFLLMGVPDRPLTNGEFFNLTFPLSPHLPYVYDQLWNWTYCGDILDVSYG